MVKRNPKAPASNGATVGFEAKLWAAADALHNNMDGVENKHVLLGLIFLKCISDAFEAKHAELEDPDKGGAITIFRVPTETRSSRPKASAFQPAQSRSR